MSPGTRIIGVQTAAAPSAYVSFRDNKVSERTPHATIADGIAVGRVGERPFEIISKYVDDMLLVEEDDVAMSILLFLERKKLVVEGAGAVALAALLANKKMFEGRKVVLIVSGGNIDFTLIDRIIHKGPRDQRPDRGVRGNGRRRPRQTPVACTDHRRPQGEYPERRA